MTVAHWCVLIAAMMPVAWAGAAKVGGVRRGAGRFDNASPREWLSHLGGWPQRANWAQQNALEAFPPFAVGVLIALQLDTDAATVNALAAVFVVARVLHGLLYIADRATARSVVWLIGFAATVLLYLLSI